MCWIIKLYWKTNETNSAFESVCTPKKNNPPQKKQKKQQQPFFFFFLLLSSCFASLLADYYFFSPGLVQTSQRLTCTSGQGEASCNCLQHRTAGRTWSERESRQNNPSRRQRSVVGPSDRTTAVNCLLSEGSMVSVCVKIQCAVPACEPCRRVLQT